MTNTKTIENCYGANQKPSRFTGVTVGDKDYFVDALDYIMGTRIPGIDIDTGAEIKEFLQVPQKAYEVVSYDENTDTAVVSEVKDRSLLEKIAIGMHNDRVVRSGLRWLAENNRWPSRDK